MAGIATGNRFGSHKGLHSILNADPRVSDQAWHEAEVAVELFAIVCHSNPWNIPFPPLRLRLPCGEFLQRSRSDFLAFTSISILKTHCCGHCAVPTLQAALISGLGLSVFAFSTFTPTQRFGWLMLSILLAGVLAELIFLPALLASPLGRAFSQAKEITQVEARVASASCDLRLDKAQSPPLGGMKQKRRESTKHHVA